MTFSEAITGMIIIPGKAYSHDDVKYFLYKPYEGIMLGYKNIRYLTPTFLLEEDIIATWEEYPEGDLNAHTRD